MGFIRPKNFERRGAASGMKPFPTTGRTAPAFKMQALGIGAAKKVLLEVLIGGTGAKAFEMRFPACGKFSFIFVAPTVWAV